MDRLFQDLRHAARSLVRAPGFAAVTAVTLALGIGATTVIFTLLNDVVLEPLPYPDSKRLVSIKHPVPGLNSDWEWPLSSGGYFFFDEHSQSLEELGVYARSQMTLAGEGVAEPVNAVVASASLFEVLQARPLHGRLLFPEDHDWTPDSRAAVLGHDFWRSRFGADPDVIGTTLRLEGMSVQVVGVAEAGLHLPAHRVDLWVPMALSPDMHHANAHFREAIGRLAPGISLDRAQAELALLTERLPEAVPTAYSESFMEESRFSTVVRPLKQEVVGEAGRLLWILLAGVGVVLLIAGANVANLFLVRMEGRRREMAVRSALGAGRAEIARRYSLEAAMLGLVACGLGLALAYGGLRLLLNLAPPDIPRLSDVAIGFKSLGFGVAVALIAAAAFGALPALTRKVDFDALRDAARGLTASRRRHAVRGAIVAGQVALALVLLASAGLLLQTFRNLRAVAPGLDPANVLAVQVSLPNADYRTYNSVGSFQRELTARVRALPGVKGAGSVTALPFSGAYDGGCSLVFPEEWDPSRERYPCVSTPRVTPGYFQALGIAVRGRTPDWSDVQSRTAGVVVSRAFADRVWPGQDPIGKGVTANASEQPHFRVVAVTDDVRAAGFDKPPVEAVYFPVVPAEGIQLWQPPTRMTLVVKSSLSNPERLTGAVRDIVAELEPAAGVGAVRTMNEVMASHRSIAGVAFALILLLIAAAVALVLGTVGLYGVVAYVVSERTHEIGIRMALGARSGEVKRLVLRQSLAMTGAGIAVGLAGAVAVTRVLQSMLFGVQPTDPATLAGVSLLLLAVTLGASWLPARRAARVDPMVALRAE